MAPFKAVKEGTGGEKIRTLLDIAERTVAILRNREDLPAEIEQSIDHHVKRSFPLSVSSATAAQLSDLDTSGCNLWNAATNLMREAEHETSEAPSTERTPSHQVQLLRTYAFLLLDTVARCTAKRQRDKEQQIRNFTIGLKSANACLDTDELGLAIRSLEVCAEYVATAEPSSPLVRIAQDDEETCQWRAKLAVLTSKFYLARMKHALKMERLDLADHFFNKWSDHAKSHISAVAEMAAEVCLDAGRSLSRQGQMEMAVRWLDRAISALDSCDLEHLSPEAAELRLCAVALLVNELLSTRNIEAISRAQLLISELDTVHGLGNRMAVQLLRLKVELQHDVVDLARVEDHLSRLLRTAVLTERTFRPIMKAIHRVNKVSADIACSALEHLVNTRILPDLDVSAASNDILAQLLEKASVTCALFATTHKSEPRKSAQKLEALLTRIAGKGGRLMSPSASHAVQTLIWKATSCNDADAAEAWCALLQHPVFDSAGHTNKALIGRRAMNTAIAKGDLEAARTAFFRMPTTAQNENISRYCAFKLAIRLEDYNFAMESLEIILKHSDRDATFVYACALEAQQSQMRHIAVGALQAIVDKQPSGVHWPSLLRCTARLLLGELEPQKCNLDEAMSAVVKVFETAASHMRELRQGSSDELWRTEVQWWSKNAYNIALKHCGQINPEQLVRMLQACGKFLNAYPQEAGLMCGDDLRKRKGICHFLTAAALVVLGRSSEEGSEYGLQCYLQARQEIKAFKEIETMATKEDQYNDHNGRLFELQKFDLECILNLQQWDDVAQALQSCLNFRHVDKWDALADIVLIIHQQVGPSGLSHDANSCMMSLLDRIINETWSKRKDIIKVSRWLRLSFTLDLEQGDGSFALKLIGLAAQMARKQQERGGESFPENEVQWLAIRAFNHAVDLLSAQKLDVWVTWVDAALELARYASDQGALHASLTEKKGRLIVKAQEVLC